MFSTAPIAAIGMARQPAVPIHSDAAALYLSAHGGAMAAISSIPKSQSVPMTVLTVLTGRPLPASVGAQKKY